MTSLPPNPPSTDDKSIFVILATLPSGQAGSPLTFEDLGKYLADNYNTEAEKERNGRHVLRDQLYRDGGSQHMEKVIDEVFDDPEVKRKRKVWIKKARITNVCKRISHRLAAVYSEPAKRFVGGADANQTRYQTVLDAVQIDEQMLQVGRLVNLHRALLVGFRVRKKPDGTREPLLEIATPANVRAIMHPTDSKLVVAWLIRCEYKLARGRENAPCWTLWTAYESMQLRDDLTVILDSYQTHPLALIPWVPLTLGPPIAGFWPGEEGEDLVAAHVSIWFQNVLLLKESKSATKITTIAGDGTNMMRGQSMDGDVPTEIRDGQSISTTDTSMNLQMFSDTSTEIIDQVGLNYELTPALIDGASVQSAEARDLQMLPVEEIRKQQQLPLRRFEGSLVVVMAAVLAEDLPAMRFDPTEFRVEFANSRTPLDPLSEQTLFEKRRAAAIDNTLAFMMRLRPGLTEEQAAEELDHNIQVETERVRAMRELQAVSGGIAAEAPSDQVRISEAPQPPTQGGGSKPPGQPPPVAPPPAQPPAS